MASCHRKASFLQHCSQEENLTGSLTATTILKPVNVYIWTPEALHGFKMLLLTFSQIHFYNQLKYQNVCIGLIGV